MGTKLKNITTKESLKIVSFILAVVFITLCFVCFYQGTNLRRGFVDNPSYLKSWEFQDKVSTELMDLKLLNGHYISEENIKNGNTIKESLAQYKKDLVAEFVYQKNIESVDENLVGMTEDPEFLKMFGSSIEGEKNRLIAKDLNQYRRLKKEVAEKSEWSYVVEKDGVVLMAFPEKVTTAEIEKCKVNLIYNNGMIDSSLGSMLYLESNYDELEAFTENGNYKISLGLSDAYVAQEEASYEEDARKGEILTTGMSVFFIGALIFCAFSCIAAGHKKDVSGTILCPIDEFYIDLHLVLLCLGECLILGSVLLLHNNDWPISLAYVIFAFGAGLGLNFLLSLVRLIKNKAFIKHLLFIKIIKKIIKLIDLGLKKGQKFYDDSLKDSSAVKRYIFFTLGITILGLLIAVPFLNILIIGLLLYILYEGSQRIKKYDEIMKGLARIKNGEADYKITGVEGGFKKLAEDINAIGDGITETVNKRVQSERLKTELITNVSHDIRTPLTSVITSIDLLKNEDLSEEEKEKYLGILENKAQRLKKLTDDLFEAAKAASGSIDVELKGVDLEILISQGIGEMEEELKLSHLDFLINYPKELLIVNADGQLLWRVVENLISNILKYAQRNTRVYIDFEKDENFGKVILKNISAQSLNMNPEELMERFKRGDETRSTEGSGLGLAIAKDLMFIQEGELKIQIDGDLFKVVLILPLAK